MATSATLEEFIIISNYRDLSDDEREQITALLGQAARQITSFLGKSDWSIPADISSGYEGDLDGSIAKDRQIHIVKRYFDNQNGITSESFDGISVSTDNLAFEGLRLTAYDKQILSENRQRNTRMYYKGIHRNNGNVW
jgi:hypothetical protein